VVVPNGGAVVDDEADNSTVVTESIDREVAEQSEFGPVDREPVEGGSEAENGSHQQQDRCRRPGARRGRAADGDVIIDGIDMRAASDASRISWTVRSIGRRA